MKDTRTSIKFYCPKCGSECFGSDSTGIEIVYHCHGERCRFEWPLKDFWKHSYAVTMAKFESEEEYNRMYRGDGGSLPTGTMEKDLK